MKKILGILSIPMMYAIFFLATKYISYVRFSWDLLFFVTIGIVFVSLHFFLDIKKMYEKMFQYRYLIGICIFLILVIGKYHGSSINIWNHYVQPSSWEGTNIIGVSRGIRSDEWLVSTPHILSQKWNGFSVENTLMGATSTDVSFYPRLVVKDYASIFYPQYLGFFFLDIERGFSFYWYLPIFALFFVSLELFMIITKKNKLYSTLGAFLIALAPPVLWWNSCSIILYGETALLVIYYFIQTNSKRKRLLLSILLGYIAVCYALALYPAWQIPYAYFFLLIFIWMIIKNKDKLKIKDSLYLLIPIFIVIISLVPLLLSSMDVIEIMTGTVYPGERHVTGGGDWRLLFTYFNTIYYPYTGLIGNPCEYCQYISLFPLPIILGIVSMVKNKKIDWFILLNCIFSILLTIWAIFPLPAILSEMTLMTATTVERAQLVVGYSSIFLLIYLISNCQQNIFEFSIKKHLIYGICAIMLSIIGCYISKVALGLFPGITNRYFSLISIIVFALLFYLLILNTKKTNIAFVIGMFIITLVSGALILPIAKGLDVIYEKPFSKKIQEIVKKDKDSVFAFVNDGVILSNYIIANGGKAINSTNYLPNLDLWHQLDSEEKYNDVYNRYAHVAMDLTEEETSFEIYYPDNIGLHLNYNDMCSIDIDYLVSSKELEAHELYDLSYSEDGVYIYITNCE